MAKTYSGALAWLKPQDVEDSMLGRLERDTSDFDHLKWFDDHADTIGEVMLYAGCDMLEELLRETDFSQYRLSTAHLDDYAADGTEQKDEMEG